MYKRILVSIILLSVAGLTRLRAGDLSTFAFDIGGGMSAPLNPTATYAGLSGNFTVGAGYNIDKHNSIIGEFMWNGLPPNTVVRVPDAPYGSMSLYTITTNYRYRIDRLGNSPFGVYVIAGGGWFYRFASIDKNYTVPPNTVCQPIYTWWGYGCEAGGYTVTQTLASKGNSTGGIDAGGGLTIRLSDTGWKFFVESRYNYAWSNKVPTTFMPVTFGFRYH
jgi:hypothetical protein